MSTLSSGAPVQLQAKLVSFHQVPDIHSITNVLSRDGGGDIFVGGALPFGVTKVGPDTWEPFGKNSVLVKPLISIFVAGRSHPGSSCSYLGATMSSTKEKGSSELLKQWTHYVNDRLLTLGIR